MNLLELLSEKGIISAKIRAEIEAEIAKKGSIVDAFTSRNLSLAGCIGCCGH